MIDSVPDILGLSGRHRNSVWDWSGNYTASTGKQCSDSKDTAEGIHFDLFCEGVVVGR